jgi:hypothetical protein
LVPESVRVPAPVFVNEPEPESGPERVAPRVLVSTVEELVSVAGTEEVSAVPVARRVPPAKLKLAVPALTRPSVPPSESVPPVFKLSVPV